MSTPESPAAEVSTGFHLTTTATRGRDPRIGDPDARTYTNIWGVQMGVAERLAREGIASVTITPQRPATPGTESSVAQVQGDGSVEIARTLLTPTGERVQRWRIGVEQMSGELSVWLADPGTISLEVSIPVRVGVLHPTLAAGVQPGAAAAAPTSALEAGSAAPASEASSTGEIASEEILEGEVVEESPAGDAPAAAAPAADAPADTAAAAGAARLAQIRAQLHG